MRGPRTFAAALAVVAATAAGGTGCAGADPAGTEAAKTPAVPASTAPTPSTTATTPAPPPSVTTAPPPQPAATGSTGPPTSAGSSPPGAGALVRYTRSGGIAGVLDLVTVQPDGRLVRVVRSEHCEVRLNPRQLADLRADLDRGGFARLRGTGATGPPAGTADGFAHEIVYQRRTIRVYEREVPARMRPALARLTRLATMPCLR